MLSPNQRGRIERLKTIVEVGRQVFCTDSLIIAGGAPRDILSDVQIKFVDIFLNLEDMPCADAMRDSYFEKCCREFAERFEDTEILSVKFNDPKEHSAYELNLDLCDIETSDGPLQVIGLYGRDPVEDVMNYDFGLSQVFVNTAGVFMTYAAMMDRQNHTITFTPSSYALADMKRSVARLGRLKAKYEGWTFVDCEQLEREWSDDQ